LQQQCHPILFNINVKLGGEVGIEFLLGLPKAWLLSTELGTVYGTANLAAYFAYVLAHKINLALQQAKFRESKIRGEGSPQGGPPGRQPGSRAGNRRTGTALKSYMFEPGMVRAARTTRSFDALIQRAPSVFLINGAMAASHPRKMLGLPLIRRLAYSIFRKQLVLPFISINSFPDPSLAGWHFDLARLAILGVAFDWMDGAPRPRAKLHQPKTLQVTLAKLSRQKRGIASKELFFCMPTRNTQRAFISSLKWRTKGIDY